MYISVKYSNLKMETLSKNININSFNDIGFKAKKSLKHSNKMKRPCSQSLQNKFYNPGKNISFCI